MYKLKLQKNINIRGYTIIETMIAVSIFLIIIAVGMDALLNANVVHTKSQDMRSIMDNLSFIMEDMSKNIRTGYNYRCINSIDDLSDLNIVKAKSGQSCWGIAFEYANGNPNDYRDQWVYKIDSEDGGGIFNISKSTDSVDGVRSFVKLNSEEVIIDGVKSSFVITGAEAPEVEGVGDQQQPFVTIKLVGEIRSRNNLITPFSLQTSVSQRLIDIYIPTTP
ncbi:MAG: hypothetical protein WC839_02800 [Candidatus Paceibacterota bacterium]